MHTFGDITISTEAFGVVSTIVLALCAVIARMWLMQVWECENSKADLRRQRDELLRVLLRHELRDEIPSSVPPNVIPPNHRPRPE